MKLISLDLEKFRSFKKPVRFKFPGTGFYHLTGRNLVQPDLEGNGVGKSSLFEGVYWILFGKTSMKLKAGDVANWETPRGCRGLLILETGQQHIKTIHRTWGPNSLKLDGREVDQETLEKELGISPETFLHSIFFPQFSESFLDLKPEQKMALLVDVLGLEVWDRASEIAGTKSGEIDREIQDLLGRVDELQLTIEEDNSIAELKHKERKWHESQREEIADYKEQIRNLAIRSDRDYDESEKELARLEREIKEQYSARADAKAQLQLCREQAGNLGALHGRHCPTCGGELRRSHLKAERARVESRRTEAEEVFRRADKRIDLLEDMLARLNKTRVAREKVERLKKDIERVRREENPYTEQREKAAAKLFKAKLRQKLMLRTVKKLRREHEVTKFWVKGFKEVRLLIVDEKIAELEAEVNQTIHELGLEGWSISFDVEKETKGGRVQRGFNVLVSSPSNPGPVPFAAWSGGESQRLRLAGAMGFANLINNMRGQQPNVELWDEPSQWMSNRGIDQMLDALAERARKYNRCIILADHRALGYGKFNSIITVVKDKHGSRIEGAGGKLLFRRVLAGQVPAKAAGDDKGTRR
jgi:DNA repair exonuclease SbcCD ATPase subunit